MSAIPMVDLQQQYLLIKEEVDQAIQDCLHAANFIGGRQVQTFEQQLAAYLQQQHVIGCANGTDALQLALMVLRLPRGSKIIVPAFTYIAPVEVIRLLGYEPVYADVDPATFNMSLEHIEAVYTKEVKAIICVHLFGQTADMKAIADFAKSKSCFLIEDNAQSIGAEKKIDRNTLITTSFFPSKNLGAYGDGGAVITNDIEQANALRAIANHGQTKRYYHDDIGINSRLDVLQAAILSVKLKYLNQYIAARQKSAEAYDEQLNNIPQFELPLRAGFSAHTFHQYTVKVNPADRNALQQHLQQAQIATDIYYPLPCYKQKAYLQENISLPNTETLCLSVLSLPIYPEIATTQLSYICDKINDFFSKR